MRVGSNLTQLIQQVGQGGKPARDALFNAAHVELRKLARARLRDGGRKNLFLQTTSLVNESYSRFVGAGQLRMTDRKSFFAYASQVMRSVIVDHVRRDQGDPCERGPDRPKTLDIDGTPVDCALVMQVEDLLQALQCADPRLAQVVQLYFFGGYTLTDISEMLEVNERTVRRDMEKARALMLEM